MFLMLFMGLSFWFFGFIIGMSCFVDFMCVGVKCVCGSYVSCKFVSQVFKCQFQVSTKCFVWHICLVLEALIYNLNLEIYCHQSWKSSVFGLGCLVCGFCIFQKSNYMLVAPMWAICFLCVLFDSCLSNCVLIFSLLIVLGM